VNFLCGYLKLLRNIQGSPTDQILRGKQPVLDISTPPVVNHVVVPPDIPWSRPSSGWVKLTIDGSFKLEDGHGGTGMILRNETGQIVFLACRFMHSCTEALEAELLACLEGLDLALQC
jgi:hypothetical protein